MEDPAVTRAKIMVFEDELGKVDGITRGDMDECPLTHTFAEGVYVREIFIPAGTLVVGKIHRHSHPNFLMKGRVTVVTEGKGRETLEAPLSMISPAGTKRIVYTHEDTVWITVHKTEETNINKIEEAVIAKDYDALPPSREHKQLTKEEAI